MNNQSIRGAAQNGLPNKLLFTIDEASHMLSLSPGMIRKLGRAGSLKITHIGRCARISQEEVLRLCNGQVVGGDQCSSR
jgi:excisionase family DNA binding protein